MGLSRLLKWASQVTKSGPPITPKLGLPGHHIWGYQAISTGPGRTSQVDLPSHLKFASKAT